MLKPAADWRFFLPISTGCRILLIGADVQGYADLFRRLGGTSINIMPNPSELFEMEVAATPPFDLILVPQGLSLGAVSGTLDDQLALYRKLRDLLAPHGILFSGFLNNLRSGIRPITKGYSSSLRKMSHVLASAGFKDLKFLGLMGNLETPDYILPLEREAIGFVLHHKFRHKVPAPFGSLFFHPWITAAFSSFLGAYFVMATASETISRDHVRSFNDRLTEYMAKNFSYDDGSLHWVLLSNGGADWHDSVILFCLMNGRNTAQFVAKVPRLPENQWALQAEYDSLKVLWDLKGESAIYRLPRPIALINFEEQPALIISHVSGENLLRASNRAFWMDRDNVRTLFVDAATSLREIFDISLAPVEDGQYPASDFFKKVERFRELYPLNSQQLQMIEDLLAKLAVNASETKHKVFIQGDFWHGNIIRSQELGQLVFVDWQYARWTTDVSLDVFLFLLAAALAAVSEPFAEKKAASAVDILLAWRLDVIPSYLEVFRTSSQYSMLSARDGMLLCCIEKAVRAGMDFGHTQQDDVIWWWMFDALTQKWTDEN